jgi:hypothetical protein
MLGAKCGLNTTGVLAIVWVIIHRIQYLWLAGWLAEAEQELINWSNDNN